MVVLKFVLVVTGILGSTAILGGFAFAVADIFKRLRRDRERRKTQRME